MRQAAGRAGTPGRLHAWYATVIMPPLRPEPVSNRRVPSPLSAIATGSQILAPAYRVVHSSVPSATDQAAMSEPRRYWVVATNTVCPCGSKTSPAGEFAPARRVHRVAPVLAL